VTFSPIGRAVTMWSTPFDSRCLWSRNTSRINRLIRLRETADP